MSVTITPLQSDVYTAVRAFLLGVLPSGVPVSRGLPNRAAMPQPFPGFVVMQMINVNRLRWNVDTWDATGVNPTTLLSEQGIQVHIQLDFYGSTSGDWANIVSTLWRDTYGCDALAPTCQPLFADDARMAPLVDSEEQYEERWQLDARLQYNPQVTVSQAFAASVAPVDLINVNEAYAP